MLVGFTAGDGGDTVAWMADKIANLRVFADAEGRMNRSVLDIGGEVLVVSQFTLYGGHAQGQASLVRQGGTARGRGAAV